MIPLFAHVLNCGSRIPPVPHTICLCLYTRDSQNG